ncbi:MAG: PQQ-binding-like beta-propeller repeat protein, partial [Akkermansiaceae bacterium]|nr:PQQ-binding-like beta-propeller repeat protein [Akkermansiaceae bacterium]
LWARRSDNGVFINSAIAVEGDHLFFVESTNPESRKVPGGRVGLGVLLGEGSRLGAIDTRSGELAWSREVDLRKLQHSLFLSVSSGTVLVSGSKNVGAIMRYELHAFDATTGKPLWSATPPVDQRAGGSHGEQDQHPAIVGDVVYTRTFAYDLKTGEPRGSWKLAGGGCGAISTCMSSAFYRSGGPMMTDLATGRNRPMSLVTRPGCWINLLPAGGLVLAPEASSGCTCGYGVQTSMAFKPVGVGEPAILAGAELEIPPGKSSDDDLFAVRTVCRIESPAPGAVMHYTTDGSWPTRASARYTKPLVLDSSTTVRCRAYLPGGVRSPVARRTLTKTTQPWFITGSQQFDEGVRVRIGRPHGV